MPRLRIPRLPVQVAGSTVLGAPSTLVSRQGFQGQGDQDGQNGQDGPNNSQGDASDSSSSSSGGGIHYTAIVRFPRFGLLWTAFCVCLR